MAVFENFDQFKGLHPAFADLTKEEMVADGLSAPLHAGAEKYYREAGLIECRFFRPVCCSPCILGSQAGLRDKMPWRPFPLRSWATRGQGRPRR